MRGRPNLQCERVQLDPLAFAGDANRRRTPGLHLTDIITDIMVSAFGIDRATGKFTEKDLENFQLQGYLWEQVATEQLAKYARRTDGAAFNYTDYVRLPEIAVSMDGKEHFIIDPDLPIPDVRGYIIMSPDGMRLGPPLRGLEFKWTTTSLNGNVKPEWFYQALGYLKGESLVLDRDITEYEWLVQYAAGDYKGSGVVVERWTESFEPVMRDQNWLMMTQHVRDRIAMSRKNGIHHAWERWAA